MCAGQTTFVPFFRGGIKPTDRVGIVGMGGLGHLAIQFASKWGCDVVVFSGTDSKKEEALGFGAKQFVNTKTLGKIDIGRKLDYLLATTSVQPDWDL
jgi:D-arabinose 1-dehydrogenase-like Zn-dependent alcohol dehydrogenase